MANVTLGANVGMNDDVTFETGGSTVNQSSGQVTMAGNGKTVTAYGEGFVFDQYGLVSGTMTSLNAFMNGLPTLAATNLSVDMANDSYDTGYGGEAPGIQSEFAFWFRGDDLISGSSGNEYLKGYGGNDSLRGYAGNDTIDGGSGIDSAVFSGNSANYTITKVSGSSSYTVKDNVGSEGTDTLINIERIQFENTVIAFDTSGSAGQIYRVYQAAFDRKPDSGGLGDWIYGVDHDGISMLDVATGFINSPEFQALYGTNPTTAELVARLYNNVLHRAPEQAGFDYWEHQLDAGFQTKTQVLLGFSESPENQAQIIGSIQNGFEYTLHV